jgi:hypothetical protein
MKNMTALLILIFSFYVHAEAPKSILVRPFKGQKTLNASLSSAIKRTILKKIAQMPGYSLVLSAEAPPSASILETLALEGEIIKEKDFYRIELLLLDLKKQSVIHAVKKPGVREEDLVRMIEAGIEALFLPVEQESKPKSGDKNNAANDFNNFVNPANQTALDFKERIKGLMSDTDKAVDKQTEEKAASSDKSDDQKTNTNNLDTKNSKITSTRDNEGLFNKINFLKIIKDHSLTALFEKKSILTKSLIETTSESSYLRLMARGHLWRNSTYKHSLNYQFEYGKPLATEVPSPNLISYGLMARTNFEVLELGAGVSKESELFYNIQAQGTGLESGTASLNWLNISAAKKWGGDKKGWLIQGQYKYPLSSQSAWRTISSVSQVQGSAIQMEISPPIVVKGVNFRIIYQKTDLKFQGDIPFSISENRIMTGAHYQF